MGGLSPLKHPLVEAFVRANGQELLALLRGYSSPVHVIFPQIFADNVDSFKRAFHDHGMDDGTFYSCKANKSNTFIETASSKGIGVEVSSFYELRDSLASGILGTSIIAGGPGKTPRYLLLALSCQAMISVDSLTEVKNVLSLATRSGQRGRIMLRVRDKSSSSRFGVGLPLDRDITTMITEKQGAIELVGFSGHLSSDAPEGRPSLAMTLLELCKEFTGLGCVNCRIVDIGGGFANRYTTEAEWASYDRGREEFWRGRTFRNPIPYYTNLYGAVGLNQILEHPERGKRLCDHLTDAGCKLAVEPGMSLLDQAGITLMRIADMKSLDSEEMIVVDGNSNHLSQRLNDEDYLISPDLISFGKDARPYEGYVAGNSCVEEDMVSWHKIHFATTPCVGDVLLFYNTAGYTMDSNESDFNRMPVPKKMCALRKRGKWEMYDDEHFTRVDLLEDSA